MRMTTVKNAVGAENNLKSPAVEVEKFRSYLKVILSRSQRRRIHIYIELL